MKIDTIKLKKRIGIDFKNDDLFQEAFTHRSFLNENREYNFNHNERLEFLGDAVLELVITEFLFRNYDKPEGDLTNWRAALVRGEMLAKVARAIDLEEFLLMSRGESKDTGKARDYLLANCVESLIGAIYLDLGYEEARKFIEKNIAFHLPEVLKERAYLDAKSHFQEKAQEYEKITPNYEVLEEWGLDHDKNFKVGVYLNDDQVAIGEGRSKQEAQRNAAQKALDIKNWD